MENGKEYIRDYPSQTIIGVLEELPNGDIRARMWPSMQIVGFYRKAVDHTTDLVGRRLSKGNTVVSLIYANKK